MRPFLAAEQREQLGVFLDTVLRMQNKKYKNRLNSVERNHPSHLVRLFSKILKLNDAGDEFFYFKAEGDVRFRFPVHPEIQAQEKGKGREEPASEDESDSEEEAVLQRKSRPQSKETPGKRKMRDEIEDDDDVGVSEIKKTKVEPEGAEASTAGNKKLKTEPQQTSEGGLVTVDSHLAAIGPLIGLMKSPNIHGAIEKVVKWMRTWHELCFAHFQRMNSHELLANLVSINALRNCMIDEGWSSEIDGEFFVTKSVKDFREKGIDGHVISMVASKLFDEYGFELPASRVAYHKYQGLAFDIVSKNKGASADLEAFLAECSFLPNRVLEEFKNMTLLNFLNMVTFQDEVGYSYELGKLSAFFRKQVRETFDIQNAVEKAKLEDTYGAEGVDENEITPAFFLVSLI